MVIVLYLFYALILKNIMINYFDSLGSLYVKNDKF